MKKNLLIFILLSVLSVTALSQDLPIGQQLIDSCLLPDIQDMVSCYQDSDCAALLDLYQACVGSSDSITPESLSTVSQCISSYSDTDNAAFFQILTDEQSCVDVLTQIEDSPDALEELQYCKTKSTKQAKKDTELGVCALGCFLMSANDTSSDNDDSLSSDTGKSCVLQCYLNSQTFAKFQQCVDDVSTVYQDQIKLALKKYKKKQIKKMFDDEDSETLGQQLVNYCLVPSMAKTAACISDSDCAVLAGQMHNCLQSQAPEDIDGKQQCVDQYQSSNNAALQKLIKTTEVCLSLESQLMENPSALAEAKECNTTFSNSLSNDPNVPTCIFGCINTGNKSCIINCITNTQEFTDLENCLDDITDKYDLQSVKKLMKNKVFQLDDEDESLMNTPDTNSTSNNSSNGTFGQSIIDNCLTPGITAEMQCLGDPDCPYLAKALGKCIKEAGKTEFEDQQACFTKFSNTLNENFKYLISVGQTCVSYDEQLYTNPYAFDEAKKCEKIFKKSVKHDISVVECAADCQTQQFTAGPCSVQCVLNSTSFTDFETCIEAIDLNDTAPMQFGDYYVSTCLIPTMTDMIACLKDPDCPSLEQQLLLNCNQGEPKLINYNFTEAQTCLSTFDTQSNAAVENVVIDMTNCLSLFSEIQNNKKALKKFKKCNQTFENDLSNDYDLGQCYMGCSSQDENSIGDETNCLITCVQQSSEFSDFQQCLNDGIPLSMKFKPFSQLSFVQQQNNNAYTIKSDAVIVENIDTNTTTPKGSVKVLTNLIITLAMTLVALMFFM